MNHFTIRLGKESFKFSSTHFTLFSADQAERLHGHNYQVAIECDLARLGDLGMGFEFNTLKPLIKNLTERWDEHVLLPKQSRLIQIRSTDVAGEPHVTVDFGKRSYRFPTDDTVLLETENITSEELARLFSFDLAQLWKSSVHDEPGSALHERVLCLRVTVEETRGQSATFVFEQPLSSVTK